jgi:hypothetical protein
MTRLLGIQLTLQAITQLSCSVTLIKQATTKNNNMATLLASAQSRSTINTE